MATLLTTSSSAKRFVTSNKSYLNVRIMFFPIKIITFPQNLADEKYAARQRDRYRRRYVSQDIELRGYRQTTGYILRNR